jgi:hypothetical protein
MQLTPLQQPWDGKISNSMDDQEVPRELVLKIKEDFQANGGNKAALEEQYSADVVHRVLGVVKNSVKNVSDSEIKGAWQRLYEDGTEVGSISDFMEAIEEAYPNVTKEQVKAVLQKLQAKYKGDFQFRNEEDEEDAKKKNVIYAFTIGEKVQIDGEGPIGIVDYMTSSQVFVKFENGEIHEYSFSEVVPVRK